MKKISALVLALCFALPMFSACSNQEKEETDTVKTPSFTEDTFPRLDGSTATIPLSEGIVSALLVKSADEAQKFVNHNKTHAAYENLIDGKCDLIFVTPPSEEETELMKQSGEEFEITMAVKDAFVFLVNKQNPIDDISSEDLKKIYTGEITNWSQLGGEDAEIIAYQRPDNSGSQTLMYKLLVPQDQIMQAPTEMKPVGMDDLINVVSDYDEGINSIGYSVYYYASGMYTDPNSKMISVDGVYPSNETIADGSYPLSDGYYAIYRKGLSEDDPVTLLMSWLLSEEGQKIAAAQGYVQLKPFTE